MKPPAETVSASPAVICVSDAVLAVSLDITLRAVGLSTRVHDPALGLGSLPLNRHSTLVIDRQVLPADPCGFIERLRGQLWCGRMIVLSEDAAAQKFSCSVCEGIAVLEKPFMSLDLVAQLPRAPAPEHPL